MIAIDHINVCVNDQEAACTFLCELLGLEDGYRPDFSFPGHWLYLGGKAIIHMMGRDHAEASSGWVDHIAFSGFDFDAETKRLDALGYVYGTGGVPGGPRQIFVTGPEGIKVELQCTG